MRKKIRQRKKYIAIKITEKITIVNDPKMRYECWRYIYNLSGYASMSELAELIRDCCEAGQRDKVISDLIYAFDSLWVTDFSGFQSAVSIIASNDIRNEIMQKFSIRKNSFNENDRLAYKACIYLNMGSYLMARKHAQFIKDPILAMKMQDLINAAEKIKSDR